MSQHRTFESLTKSLDQAVATVGLSGQVSPTQTEHGFRFSFDVETTPEVDVQLDELMELLRSFADKKQLTITADRQRFDDRTHLFADLSSDESLQDFNKLGRMEAVVNDLVRALERELKTRQTRRKREELPDPTKPADAHVNRKPSSLVQVKIRLEPSEAARLKAFNEASGKTNTDIIREALNEYYERHPVTPDDNEPSP